MSDSIPRAVKRLLSDRGLPAALTTLPVSLADPSDEPCAQCRHCLSSVPTDFGVSLASLRMCLCPTCGHKRCPRATDHRLACTGSNEPGQPGSAYAAEPASGSEDLRGFDAKDPQRVVHTWQHRCTIALAPGWRQSTCGRVRAAAGDLCSRPTYDDSFTLCRLCEFADPTSPAREP